MSQEEDAKEVAAILKGHKKCEECKKYFPPEEMPVPFFAKEILCNECYDKLYGCTID